jgi:hypothetical protein
MSRHKRKCKIDIFHIVQTGPGLHSVTIEFLGDSAINQSNCPISDAIPRIWRMCSQTSHLDIGLACPAMWIYPERQETWSLSDLLGKPVFPPSVKYGVL